MSKQLFAVGVSVLAVCSFAVLSGGATSAGPGPTQGALAEPGGAAQATPARTPAADPVRLGARLQPVPVSLAAHLGLSGDVGLLVARTGTSTPEGLEEFDVILEVNREPADLATLDRAIARQQGLTLRLVRAGVEHRVAIAAADVPRAELERATAGAPAAVAATFLSTDSLDADHPFHRLVAYRELKDGYASKAEAFRALAQETEATSRELREAARQEASALQERCEAEVAAYTAAREKELLALLDERLDARLLGSLAELRLELRDVLPEERVAAVAGAWESVSEKLGEGFEAHVVFESEHQDLVNRAAKHMRSISREGSKLVSERIGRVWDSGLQDMRQHESRLAPRHDEQAAWAASTLDVIRTQLRERVSCAFRRTREEFSKQLTRRLADLDVPRPGEVAGCMEDVRAQTDRMARRFIARTEAAVERFEREVGRANGKLAAATDEHLPACQSALQGVAKDLTALRESHFSAPRPLDASWQSREDQRDLQLAVRAGFAGIADDGRNAMRAACTPLVQAFREHRVVCDDAWRDLRQYLGEVQSEASNDCWKIDGPHLDGRFPEAPEADEKPRGEVTMMTD